MLRKGRSSQAGQYYLITTTAFRREPIFVQREPAEIVLSSLEWLEDAGRFNLAAAVVMPDHLHFVGALRTGTLGELMKSLKGFTAREINRVLGRKGPIWQEQYHDHGIRKDEDLMEVARYCLHNPVRAGLVKDFHDYPYWYCQWEV